MDAAGTDAEDVGQSLNLCGSRSLNACAVPELARVIKSPGPHRAVIASGHDMLLARRPCGDAAQAGGLPRLPGDDVVDAIAKRIAASTPCQYRSGRHQPRDDVGSGGEAPACRTGSRTRETPPP